MSKRFFVAIALGSVLSAATVVGQEKECKTLTSTDIQALIAKVKAMPLEPVGKGETAVIETNYGKMVIEFYPNKTPKTCSYFKRLAKAGFYDCIKFHRVVKGFVIQGGDILSRDNDPGNDGTGDPGYNIPAEFNDIKHKKGILSMARSADPNSAGSQFFICLGDVPHLDGKYTAFGKVIQGIEVLDRIAQVKTGLLPGLNELSRPETPVFMKKVYMVEK